MPSVSQKQRAFLYATKGKAWVEQHGFDNKGKLPVRAKKKKAGKKKPAKKRTKKRY